MMVAVLGLHGKLDLPFDVEMDCNWKYHGMVWTQGGHDELDRSDFWPGNNSTEQNRTA
jgi:hypothetical protein